MMKPNLKSFSISEISLSGTVKLTDDLIERIRAASPPDEDGDSLFHQVYKAENSGHIGWASVSEPTGDGNTCRFSLHYRVGRVSSMKAKLPSVDVVIGILSEFAASTELTCYSRFEFKKRDKVKTIVHLPLVLSELRSLPFDEIRGLHLSRTEGRRSVYDVILDRGQDGSLDETVFFRCTTRITDSLVDEIIDEAVEISNEFVVKEK